MVIATIGAAIAGLAAVGAAWAAGTAITLATFLVPAAIAAVGGFILARLAPTVDPQGLDITGASARTIRSAVLPARWVLGRARVAGVLVWLHEDDDVLHLIYVLAEAPVDRIEAAWINGERANAAEDGRSGDDVLGQRLSGVGTRYGGSISMTAFLSGAPGRSPPAELADITPRPWTSLHELRGLAWVYVRIRQNDYGTDIDERLWSSVPELHFLVRGAQIAWPGQTTPIWTENAAAIRYWWLTERRGIPADEIDRAAFDAAYAVCDENISLTGLDGYDPIYPETIKRYSINGVVTAGDRPDRVEANMDAAWAGFAVEFDGVYRFLPGAERAVSASIGPDDIIAPPTLRPAGEQHERVNRLTARVAQSHLHDWTEYSLEAVNDLPAQVRDGELLASDIGTLHFVSCPVQGLNLLTIHLRRERSIEQIDLVVAPGADFGLATIAPGDIVSLTIPEWEIDGARYMVLSSAAEPDWSIRLSLVASPDGIYADSLSLPGLDGGTGLIPDPDDPTAPQVATPPTPTTLGEYNQLGAAHRTFSILTGEPFIIFGFWSRETLVDQYQYQYQPASVAAPIEDAWIPTTGLEWCRSAWLTAHGGDFDAAGDYRWWLRATTIGHRASEPVAGATFRVVETYTAPTITLTALPNNRFRATVTRPADVPTSAIMQYYFDAGGFTGRPGELSDWVDATGLTVEGAIALDFLGTRTVFFYARFRSSNSPTRYGLLAREILSA